MRVLSGLLLSSVGLVGLSMPALAQDARATVESGEDDVNAIVVTARRRAETVQDVPQTVNVVTAEEVEKLNLRNFTEIQNVVPGLQLQSASAFANNATVRGIAFAPQASGTNPSVEFYLNDAPISSGFLFQSTFDFGQFELLRGPQGTLRGRAAPSGSITVTTRRPDLSEVGVVVNGTMTDLHARKLDGAFNIPIIADVLAVRLAGVIDNNRADRVHSLSEETNPQFSKGPYSRTKAIRGSVRFEPTDWAAFNVMYQDLHSERHTYDQLISESVINPNAPAATTPIIRASDRLAIDEQGSFNRQDQQVLVGNVDIDFAGQRLSYVGSWNKQDFGVLAPQDAGNFFAPPRVTLASRLPGDPAGFDPVCTNEVRAQGAILTTGVYDQCTHSFVERKSHELRLASNERIAGIFDYIIGGFYDKNEPNSNLTSETPVVANAAAVPVRVATVARTAILRRGTSTEKSVFGNLTAHLLDDRLELSGGLRYIDYKNDSLPTLTSSATGAVPCAELTQLRCNQLGTSGSFKDNATIYTASVKYKITPDINIYALTGSSWRPGPRVVGVFSAQISPFQEQFLNLPAETSKSYEVGVKTTFLGGRGRFNLSAFYQDFKNYPFRGPSVFYVSTNTGTGRPEVANFNYVSPVPVEVKGVELETSLDVMDRLNLRLNASYADGKIKNGLVACNDLNGDGIPDINPPTPTLPDLQAAVGANNVDACTVSRRSTDAPKFSANAQAEYGFDIGANADGFVRGLYSFFGKTASDPDNAFDDVGAYGLLNLYAGIRDKEGAWEVTLFAKNVTKELEILTVGGTALSTSVRTPAGSSSFAPQQYRTITTTAPREFGISARIALGSR